MRAETTGPVASSRQALDDLLEAAGRADVWLALAWHDVRQRFRRSVLGPLWITLAMAIMVTTLSLVLEAILGRPMAEVLPYVAIGLVFWGLFSTTMMEATTVFADAASSIKNLAMPIATHPFRMLARNGIIWLFNMVIVVAITAVLSPKPSMAVLLLAPGLLLFVANLAWMSLLVAMVSARYRDTQQIVVSGTQILFFLTPIFWSADQLPARPAFVTLNPLAHLFEIVRAPLLGASPNALSWIVASTLLGLGTLVTIVVYRRAHPRIPYWV